MKPTFSPATDIALKIPSHEHEAMVRLYRDVFGFKLLRTSEDGKSIAFEFGSMTLWLDSVAALSQAEIWLEINTGDLASAQSALAEAGCVIRNEVEQLPEGFEAFWVSTPSNLIHLVSKSDPQPPGD